MRIYVASSWRNETQPSIVQALRNAGHEVYDFKDPEDNGGTGFHWSDIDAKWQDQTPQELRAGLSHRVAVEGFNRDLKAMEWADAFVLVMPCGRSAHLEAGWAIGAGKPTTIFMGEKAEPELMYGLADCIVTDTSELIYWAARAKPKPVPSDGVTRNADGSYS